MKKTFLCVYLLQKVVHKKAPAIPRFVDKKIYKKEPFSPLTLIVKKSKKYFANVKNSSG